MKSTIISLLMIMASNLFAQSDTSSMKKFEYGIGAFLLYVPDVDDRGDKMKIHVMNNAPAKAGGVAFSIFYKANQKISIGLKPSYSYGQYESHFFDSIYTIGMGMQRFTQISLI